MSQEVITILDDLAKRLGIAVDWTAENIMPQIYQLGDKIVAYEFWTSIFYMILAIAVAVGCILLIKKLGGVEELEILAIFPIFGIAGGVITAFFMIVKLITCTVFPEKIIFDFIQNLIVGG